MEINMGVEFVIEREGTFSAKYNQNCACGVVKPIYCGVADMDIAAPEPILSVMRRRLNHGVMGYTDLPETYKTLVASWMKAQYGCPVKKEWVLFSPRINMALNMAVDTFTERGDSVLVNTPAYPALTNAVEQWGRRLKESPLILRDGRFTIDFDGLEALVDESTKAYILCNPHNPTGRVWTRKELEGILNFCRMHNLMLLSDDIHADFAWPGNVYTPLLSLCGEPEGERIILFNSLTKTLNIPGIIFSNVIVANKDMREALAETMDRWGLHNPNVFAADILIPAYTECREWIEEMQALIYNNLRTAESLIRRELPMLDVLIPEGTYLMWIGYRRTGLKEEEMQLLLEEKAGLVPLMGTHFKEAGRGYFRLNMGTSKEQAQKILERLAMCWA